MNLDLPETFGAPDVPLGRLIVFEPAAPPVAAPEGRNGLDVPLAELVVFVAPDVRLETFEYFDAGALPPKGVIREWTESLGMVVVFILLLTGYVTQATQVPTPSMVPTIMVGDHFFIEKIAFPGNYPEAIRPYLPKRLVSRGDIIVFKPPKEQGETPFVKRVVGLPGEEIEVRDRTVFINGEKLDEPYKIHTYPSSSSPHQDMEAKTIPPDNFFVMGDNRDNSLDSRYWGTVHREAIIGMPLFVYWSYETEPNMPGQMTWRERVADYASVAAHFLTRTRWFRFGTLVR